MFWQQRENMIRESEEVTQWWLQGVIAPLHARECLTVCSAESAVPAQSCLLSSLHKRPQTTNVQRKDHSNAEIKKNMLATFEVCHLLYQINSKIINI